MPSRSRQRDDEASLKVLVVEDEILIGMDLVMLLEEWGYNTIGPVKNLDAAFEVIRRDLPDFCILDVNLGSGETSLPLAEALANEEVPFVFLSGYEESRYADSSAARKAPHLRKPVNEHALRGLLAELMPLR